ncbi:dethiobiotin synthase [Gluconacetobacter takamatsuzukensis]|uniref:ATP-dependent dethiobiotin synthetase BioD n=1 Tax=Gluconacetobacter takamatsuzukensis TaxID=1286190 RepID=A0A7W4PRW2_9PROT|nr:dethiobiotin synthase [Gluconacetobacter takamatsuzukensis]MBB2204326.1 dethiobiotin synthase [Gluconacetobacter takamatsuzukensis]
MTMRKQHIAARFGAAETYDDAARVQRLVAGRLAERIAATGVRPARILEVGCGTGFLSSHLRRLFPDAELTVSDLAPEMRDRARRRLDGMPGQGALHALVLDAEAPETAGGGYDLICSSLSMQWFTDRAATLARLAAMLAPGGMLAFSTLCAGSFAEWRRVHAAAGLDCAIPPYQAPAQLEEEWPRAGQGLWQEETILDRPETALAFVRELRQIGASLPREGTRPVAPGTMRRLLRALETPSGVTTTYRVGYGLFHTPARPGVFVTGTDTGVGKTLVSACLVRAWAAEYWKPFQTGIAEDIADSVTVAELAGLDPARIHPPAAVLSAPLSPFDAAERENTVLDTAGLRLPARRGAQPLVVEGAGGVMVPVAPDCMMIDLIARFALPVVLVARSQLGTINHTLLTLQALRQRGIAIAGVVLNGPPSAEARRAVSLFGGARVLAEFPHLDEIGPAQVDTLARLLPSFANLSDQR